MFFYYFILCRVHVLVCLFAGFHFSHLLEQLEARSGLSRSLLISLLFKLPVSVQLWLLLLKCLLYTSFSLQADDIENEANELNRIKNYLYGKLAEHTGHSVEKVSIFCWMFLLGWYYCLAFSYSGNTFWCVMLTFGMHMALIFLLIIFHVSY